MEKSTIIMWSVIGSISIIIFVLILMFGLPLYSVWQQGLSGQAALKRAEQDRKIVIEEAKALKESAVFKNEAEIIRAEGVAEANKIIGNSLEGKEEYLRYLFIDMLRDTGSAGRETIYIPTEAAMPILEAGRIKTPVQISTK